MPNKQKYFENTCIGPYNIYMVKRIGKKSFGEFICPYCKKHFIASASDISSGKTRSCGCFRKRVASHTISDYVNNNRKNLIGKKFERLLVIDQKKIDGRLFCICKCDCGNITKVRPNRLLNKETISCGCINSIGEYKIAKILSKNNIRFLKEYKFNDCINPETNKKLRFDFYLPDYNCCIEYDGEQHFKEKECFGGKESFISLQKRDKIKNDFCKEKNIKLFRIPYTDIDILNEKYIFKLLN